MSAESRHNFAPAIAIVASIVLMGAVLWLEGRLVFCSCGVFRVWSGDPCSSTNSQQLFDPYSFTHILHGFLLFWLLTLIVRSLKPARRLAPSWQLWVAVTIEAAWEMFENTSFVIDRYRAETA